MYKGKIVLIGTIPPPAGGDAMWAQDYLAYNEKHGNDIQLVNTSLIGKRASTVGETKNYRDEIERSFMIWKAIIQTVSRRTTDIVHMNINCAPLGTIRDFISSIILALKKVPFVVHCHCNIADQIGDRHIPCCLLKCICKLSKKIIVLNNDSYEFASKIDKKKVVFIPNFITTEQFRPDKKIFEELKKAVYVGHIRRTKGIDELLEVARNNKNIVFTLVGPITEDYKKEEILDNSIGNVILTESVTQQEVNKYLDEADVFLFPSYTEGFSRALVEAMSRGIPCIATDVGSNREMLENEGGIIIEAKSSVQINKALDKIKNHKLREKMSQWNYEKAFKFYSIDTVMEEIYQIYSEVTGEKN
ncbi:MAG: glycosyltransferase family 4 protein [Tyzzerella sp.]|nr:glycosyltransferase family 4 protein [Tyzzerella sp.]